MVLRVLAVGDEFMNPEAMAEKLREVLSEVEPELEVKALKWGFKGYQLGRRMGVKREIREFSGKPEDLIPHVKGVHVLVVHVAPVTKEVMEASGALKVVGCTRGGPVNVDVDAATQLGIPVLRTPGRNAEAVADYVIGLIIAHTRNIAKAHHLLRQGVWRDEFYFYEECGFELEGKRLGLIGFGKVGVEVAKRARALGMRIMAYDPYVSSEAMRAEGVEPVDMETLLRDSDIVSLHARLTDETYHMIGEKEFKAMKPTAIFVNTARGELVDEQALIKALKEGWIAGAALDVFEKEPLPPDSPLLKLENVTITPHIAGASKETVHRSATMIAEDVKRILKGEKPRFCVNPEVLSK